MKTTVLGFASIILSGVAAAPLLVQTDMISAQPFEPLVVSSPAPSACVDLVGRLRAAGSEPERYVCRSAPSLAVADAR